ncbi:MAG: dihydropteroate synthase [Alphaproteobacteria bacterium]|nr:dihydropteroate synthase [Alphaproteobacteria bacterium]
MSQHHPQNTIFGPGPHVMGIVNVTPDSFSDGGHYASVDNAIAHGLALVQQGARILDVGGESTRPGAVPVDVAEEIRRVVPVIEGLKGAAPWISVDTRHAATMRAALAAGANMINDISALRHDPDAAPVVAQAGVPVVLMHMQGTPETMQNKPFYNNTLQDIAHFFVERTAFCETHRIDPNLIILDPGIGFGKSVEDNVTIIRNIKSFMGLNVPLMFGASRKSFIAALSKNEAPQDRLAGSLAAVLFAYSQGVDIFRVHDVAASVQALKIFSALSKQPPQDL